MSYTARISFNSNLWAEPSGTEGKSTSPTAFESIYGFGFEEWLFCDRNQFKDEDGKIWQYGYIQGIAQSIRKPDITQEIDLWTLRFLRQNNMRNPRYFVGTIRNWSSVDFDENKRIIETHPKSNR